MLGHQDTRLPAHRKRVLCEVRGSEPGPGGWSEVAHEKRQSSHVVSARIFEVLTVPAVGDLPHLKVDSKLLLSLLEQRLSGCNGRGG